MAEIKHLHVLSAESMLSNSYTWLNNPEVVQALDGDLLGRGALAKIGDAHRALIDALEWKRQSGTSLVDLTRRITEQGRTYDRLVRAIHGFLTALAESADDPDEAQRYLAARAYLLPIGLAITKKSYAREHGAVLTIEDNMTPEMEAFLRQHMVGTRSLWELYRRWLAAGEELGALIKERARLQAARAGAAEGTPMSVHAARQVWMRVVRIFVGAVALSPLSDEVRRVIFAPLRGDIANTLEARRQRQSRAEAGADEPVGSEPPGQEIGYPDASASGAASAAAWDSVSPAASLFDGDNEGEQAATRRSDHHGAPIEATGL